MRTLKVWIPALLIGSISTAQNAVPVKTQVWEGQNFSTAATSHEIKRARPEISNQVLAWDSKLIHEAQPAIEAKFKKAGLTPADAREASLAGWMDVRLYSELQPDKRMNRFSYFDFVTSSLGKVTFTSEPDKATVHVNGSTVSIGDTECAHWYPGGTIRVVFERKGFKSVEKDCAVKAPGYNECRAELQPEKE